MFLSDSLLESVTKGSRSMAIAGESEMVKICGLVVCSISDGSRGVRGCAFLDLLLFS